MRKNSSQIMRLRSLSLYRLIICIISFICISSCKIGQVYKTPDLNIPEQFRQDSLATDLTTGFIADIGMNSIYSDTILTHLINRALENNKDMLIASARIKEMAFNKRIKNAPLFPGLEYDLSGDREYNNPGGNNASISSNLNGVVSVGWELDLWGNLRWQKEAGLAEYFQSIEAQRALQLTIVAEVASLYFELKTLNRKYEIITRTLGARTEGVNFARIRYEGGITSEIPYRQSLVEEARTKALIPDIENQLTQLENDLAFLLGEFPNNISPLKISSSETLSSKTSLSDTLSSEALSSKALSSETPSGRMPIEDNPEQLPTTSDLPPGLPSTLLLRRPDVREAEYRLREVHAKMGVAFTDQFPRIKLTASVGGENSELTDFLKSPFWYLAGSLTGPLFQMGKNHAAYKAAQARYEQETLGYQKKILEVLKEASNAIKAYNSMREKHEYAETLYQSSRTYHDLAKLQYVNGAVSYIDVLDAQRQLFDAELLVNDAILNELLATVQLYKVLGGNATIE